MVHVYLIGTYSKSIRQHQAVDSIIKNNVSLTCMTMTDPALGWFRIIKVPTYDLNDFTGGNDKHVENSSVRVSQFFNNTSLIRYPCPRKVIFVNVYAFKRDLTTLLNDFDIKTVLKTIKKPQANDPVERLHQVILYILINKYISNKFFDYINPWGENLSYTAWATRDSYHHTVQDKPFQNLFGREIIFNLASVIYW